MVSFTLSSVLLLAACATARNVPTINPSLNGTISAVNATFLEIEQSDSATGLEYEPPIPDTASECAPWVTIANTCGLPWVSQSYPGNRSFVHWLKPGVPQCVCPGTQLERCFAAIIQQPEMNDIEQEWYRYLLFGRSVCHMVKVQEGVAEYPPGASDVEKMMMNRKDSVNLWWDAVELVMGNYDIFAQPKNVSEIDLPGINSTQGVPRAGIHDDLLEIRFS